MAIQNVPVSTIVSDPDIVVTGTITTTDIVVAAPAGGGAFVSGASTAGSYVVLACPGGDSAWNIQITGLTTGTLYFEISLDSTNGADGQWINVNGRQTGVVNTVLAGNSTTNGMYRGNTSGAKYIRIRAVGALTGTPAIVIRISGGIGAIFLNASIPAGSNLIGATDLQPSATGTQSSVASSATSGTLLAANTNRRMATVFNDGTATLYLLLVLGTASTTVHTVQVIAGGYYELPYRYTGIIVGVWATASGSARITELT